ncbi:MAG: hypothetical protein AAB250_02715, partial [Bdellovibrionota bacterium]
PGKLTDLEATKVIEAGKKLFQHAVNVEFAWETLEKWGLRKKLMQLDSPNQQGGLAYYMNKDPLRTKPIGQPGPDGTLGKTAAELKLSTLTHETSSLAALETITRAHTGVANFYRSRNGFTGERAAHGDGVYFKPGLHGAVGTNINIRVTLDPNAREGSDFTRAYGGEFIIVNNRAAIMVQPESLKISPTQYFEILASGKDISSTDVGLMEKLRRRVGTKLGALSDQERAVIMKHVIAAIDGGRFKMKTEAIPIVKGLLELPNAAVLYDQISTIDQLKTLVYQTKFVGSDERTRALEQLRRRWSVLTGTEARFFGVFGLPRETGQAQAVSQTIKTFNPFFAALMPDFDPTEETIKYGMELEKAKTAGEMVSAFRSLFTLSYGNKEEVAARYWALYAEKFNSTQPSSSQLRDVAGYLGMDPALIVNDVSLRTSASQLTFSQLLDKYIEVYPTHEARPRAGVKELTEKIRSAMMARLEVERPTVAEWTRFKRDLVYNVALGEIAEHAASRARTATELLDIVGLTDPKEISSYEPLLVKVIDRFWTLKPSSADVDRLGKFNRSQIVALRSIRRLLPNAKSATEALTIMDLRRWTTSSDGRYRNHDLRFIFDDVIKKLWSESVANPAMGDVSVSDIKLAHEMIVAFQGNFQIDSNLFVLSLMDLAAGKAKTAAEMIQILDEKWLPFPAENSRDWSANVRSLWILLGSKFESFRPTSAERTKVARFVTAMAASKPSGTWNESTKVIDVLAHFTVNNVDFSDPKNLMAFYEGVDIVERKATADDAGLISRMLVALNTQRHITHGINTDLRFGRRRLEQVVVFLKENPELLKTLRDARAKESKGKSSPKKVNGTTRTCEGAFAI